MIYVASPYSHVLPGMREARYRAVVKFCAEQIKFGNMVYSPIAHSHGMATIADAPVGFAHWMEHDLHMLRMAEELWILQLAGWEQSEGIRREKFFAEEHGIPIRMVANKS